MKPLGLTAEASAADAAIQQNLFESGMTTLIISNKEMIYIMKLIKILEEAGLFVEDVSRTIENKAKNKNVDMLLGTLGAGLLANMLRGKGAKR